MTHAQTMRPSGFCGIAAFQSTVFAFLIWIEVGRSFGWPDVVVALGAGLLVTGIMSALLFFKNSSRLRFRLPAHRVARFIVKFGFYSCGFIAMFSILVADRRFLHSLATERRGFLWAVIFGMWMGFWFAFTRIGQNLFESPMRP